MSELKINFSGICTHFWNVFPGLPMRTVLPNAGAANLRAITMPQTGAASVGLSYNTMPHVPLLVITDNIIDDQMPAILGEPIVLAGAHLQIVNTDFSPPSIVPTRPPGGFSLTSYVDNFAFSDDVVFNGRAAGYFDTFAATSLQVNGTLDQARSTTVTMNTIGTPQLLITPFPGSLMPLTFNQPSGTPWVIPIPGHLWVMNVDFNLGPAVSDTAFDFLLNYLVSLKSIPDQLTSVAPGMPALPLWSPIQSPTPLMVSQQFQSAVPQFQAFATFAKPFPNTADLLKSIATSQITAMLGIILDNDGGNPMGSSQACSDSNYP